MVSRVIQLHNVTLWIWHFVVFNLITAELPCPGRNYSRMISLKDLQESTSLVEESEVQNGLLSDSKLQSETDPHSLISSPSKRKRKDCIQNLWKSDQNLEQPEDGKNRGKYLLSDEIVEEVKPKDIVMSAEIPFLIKPRKFNRHYPSAEPIDLTMYASPMAFDFDDDPIKTLSNAKRPSYGSSEKPLGLLELVQMPSVALWLDFSQLSIAFDHILEIDLSLSAKPDQRKRFCPILCFVAAELGRCMAVNYESLWKKIGSQFTDLKLISDFNLEIEYKIFLPFIYRFLILKPTPQQWLNIETLWLKFFISWKIQLIYLSSIANKKFESRKAQVIEKAGKAMMWISDVLCEMYFPKFLSHFRYETTRCQEHTKNGFKGRPPGYFEKSPLARLFESMISKDNYSGRVEKSMTDKGISELLKHWQIDCHAGYPFSKSGAIQQSRKRLAAQEQGTKGDLRDTITWDTWSSTCLAISSQIGKVDDALSGRKPWLELEQMRNFVHGKTQKRLDINQNTWTVLKRIQNSYKRKNNNALKSKLTQIYDLIPNLEKDPVQEKEPYGIKVFDYFLSYQNHFKPFQYLPEKISIFFNMDDDDLINFEPFRLSLRRFIMKRNSALLRHSKLEKEIVKRY